MAGRASHVGRDGGAGQRKSDDVMGSASCLLRSRLATCRSRPRSALDLRRPSRHRSSTPSAPVTSHRELNREVSILGEKSRNDVCHRC